MDVGLLPAGEEVASVWHGGDVVGEHVWVLAGPFEIKIRIVFAHLIGEGGDVAAVLGF